MEVSVVVVVVRGRSMCESIPLVDMYTVLVVGTSMFFFSFLFSIYFQIGKQILSIFFLDRKIESSFHVLSTHVKSKDDAYELRFG